MVRAKSKRGLLIEAVDDSRFPEVRESTRRLKRRGSSVALGSAQESCGFREHRDRVVLIYSLAPSALCFERFGALGLTVINIPLVTGVSHRSLTTPSTLTFEVVMRRRVALLLSAYIARSAASSRPSMGLGAVVSQWVGEGG